MTIEQKNKLEAYLRDVSDDQAITVLRDEPLAAHCTFKIGGSADYFLEPNDENSACTLIHFLQEEKIRYRVVGRGSNLLFADGGYRGVIVASAGLCAYRIEDCLLTVGAGMSVTALAGVAMRNGLGGMEFYYGIPGSVGGAVYMNAGAYDGETAAIVERVRCYDRAEHKIVEYTADACAFSYRHSRFQDGNSVILEVTFRLYPKNSEEIRARMEELMQRRIEKQPLNYPSAGSTFKRYPGRFTAQMIDEAGLKGMRVGDAQVSEKHAGFLVNLGAATGDDMRALIALVKEKVYKKHGVLIACEVEAIEEKEDEAWS